MSGRVLTVEERFEQLLTDTKAQMPDEESATQIVTAYRQHWKTPPLEPLELVLQRTTSLSDARLLLFFPEPVDMLAYVGLITGAPRGAPDSHPQNKLRKPFLALLYMKHVRSWPLMREFVREGGLLALAAGFDDEAPPRCDVRADAPLELVDYQRLQRLVGQELLVLEKLVGLRRRPRAGSEPCVTASRKARARRRLNDQCV